MRHFSSFPKLFHGSLWVLAWGVVAGCHRSPSTVNIEGLELPANHREVNWMEVLDNLPQDKNRAKQWDHLRQAHPEFWAAWCEDILQLGASEDTASVEVLAEFLAQMRPMLEAIDTTSGSAEVIERESALLRDGLKRLSVLDPSAKLPDVVWMPSGFNFAIYPGPDWVGVGLDWFLGSDHPMLSELPPARFPHYRLQRMRPEWMASDALKGWLLVSNQDRIPAAPRTVDMWLYWGKIMHLTSRCLPDATPAQMMNWTDDEWDWAVKHERATWAEMQPQDRMFSSNPKDVMRWFQEGPFTRVGRVPQDSPDRLGIFLGWRAVEAAMKANPDWTEVDLLNLQDTQPVLRSYRP